MIYPSSKFSGHQAIPFCTLSCPWPHLIIQKNKLIPKIDVKVNFWLWVSSCKLKTSEENLMKVFNWQQVQERLFYRKFHSLLFWHQALPKEGIRKLIHLVDIQSFHLLCSVIVAHSRFIISLRIRKSLKLWEKAPKILSCLKRILRKSKAVIYQIVNKLELVLKVRRSRLSSLAPAIVMEIYS